MAEDVAQIELRFAGEGISPDNVRLKELSEILVSLEEALVATIEQEFGDIPRAELLIGLNTIRHGSLDLGFALSQPQFFLPVWRQIGTAIQTSELSRLPNKAIESLGNILKFVRKRQCRAELRITDVAEPLALITPESDLYLANIITGRTTLYGRVVRVGGDSPPTVRISPHKGETITCKATVNHAKILAHRLYEYVGVEGTAIWQIDTFDIVGFTIDSILDYDENNSIVETFNQLRDDFGHYFNDIEDVDEYVRQLRDDMEA